MPSYIVDLTLSDAHAEMESTDITEALDNHFPGAVVESWKSETGESRFWRVLTYTEERNVPEVLQRIARTAERLREELGLPLHKTVGVQVSVRDGSFDIYDAIPLRWQREKSAGGRQGRTRLRHAGEALGTVAFALVVAESIPF